MIDFIIKYWLEFLFGIISAGLIAAVRTLSVRNQAVADGMKYLLMYRLRDEGEKLLNQGSCQITQKQEYEKVYRAYHALGGNDTITQLKDQVLRLPV